MTSDHVAGQIHEFSAANDCRLQTVKYETKFNEIGIPARSNVAMKSVECNSHLMDADRQLVFSPT